MIKYLDLDITRFWSFSDNVFDKQDMVEEKIIEN